MDEIEFKRRTRAFAVRCMKVCDALPQRRSADVLARQLLRSATSVSANYRAACRAKSRKDMVSKLSIVEEEGDESIHWMDLIVEGGLMKGQRLRELIAEGNEIVAMTVASIKTLRSNAANPKSKIQNPK